MKEICIRSLLGPRCVVMAPVWIIRMFLFVLLRPLRHCRRHSPRPPSRSLLCVTCCLAILCLNRIVVARVYASHMSDTIVETQFGKLRGVLVTLPNKNLPQVEAYLGLQYASVLGGELRFMPPTGSLEKWDGTRGAVNYRPVCPQRIPTDEELRKRMPLGRVAHFKRIIPFLEKQSEECLNLNVYVPVRGRFNFRLHSMR